MDDSFNNHIKDVLRLAQKHSLNHIAYDEIFNLESLLTGKILHTDFEKRLDKKFSVLNHQKEVGNLRPLSGMEVKKKGLSTSRSVSIWLIPLIWSTVTNENKG
ncbi:MAG: hypothetical protein ACYCUI_15735 [Vulcanimicrobiaceae bacterium]